MNGFKLIKGSRSGVTLKIESPVKVNPRKLAKLQDMSKYDRPKEKQPDASGQPK